MATKFKTEWDAIKAARAHNLALDGCEKGYQISETRGIWSGNEYLPPFYTALARKANRPGECFPI